MSRFDDLLNEYLAGTISEGGLRQLLNLWKDSDAEVSGKILELLDEGNFGDLSASSREEIVFSRVLEQARHHQRTRVVTIRWWSAAAAMIILTLGIGYFLLVNKKATVKQSEKNVVSIPGDLKAPVSNRAMITLANGQKIFLDSANKGTLATQNSIAVIKTEDGKIEYSEIIPNSKLDTRNLPLVYNTLTNPRGSKVVDLILSDGTHVWLDAESSITYPVAFAGNERKVTISGEAYFEVVHDASKPFHLLAKNTDIVDVGTSFNVNVYDNEPAMKITLVEGGIDVTLRSSGGQKSRIKLAPAGQLSFDKDGNSSLNKNADIELALAWKNGLTKFRSADIKTIMRQVERWYDIDVLYEGNIPDRSFTGGVSGKANLSELLKILELSNIRFRIEGRKLVVTP